MVKTRRRQRAGVSLRRDLCYDSWSLSHLGYLYPGTTPVMIKLDPNWSCLWVLIAQWKKAPTIICLCMSVATTRLILVSTCPCMSIATTRLMLVSTATGAVLCGSRCVCLVRRGSHEGSCEKERERERDRASERERVHSSPMQSCCFPRVELLQQLWVG